MSLAVVHCASSTNDVHRVGEGVTDPATSSDKNERVVILAEVLLVTICERGQQQGLLKRAIE